MRHSSFYRLLSPLPSPTCLTSLLFSALCSSLLRWLRTQRQFLPSLCLHSVGPVSSLEARLFFLTCHCQLYTAGMAGEAQILRGLEEFPGSQEPKVIKEGRSNQLCQVLLTVQ